MGRSRGLRVPDQAEPRSSGRESPGLRKAALSLYWVGIFLATHWPEIDRYKPSDNWPFRGFDSLVHASLYAGWVVMWWWLLSADGGRLGRPAVVWLLVAGLTYAVFDEATQGLVDRTPDPKDLLFDLLGILTGLLLVSLWQRSRMSRAPSREHRPTSRVAR